jgi:glycosyltransferase involved in cell wall biosynthesis
LVQGGAEVEWFSASYPGAAKTEVIDGVRVVRVGRQWTVHLRAFEHYRGKLRGRFDLVIDQVNTIPFFTPLWADIPIFMMIWQLAREVWWYESPFPLNAIGYCSEPMYLRIYRKVPVLTFSESTKLDLRRLGFRSNITVAPVGIGPVTVGNIAKHTTPSFIYVGRLAPSKRVSDILEAFALFLASIERGRLYLVGDGPASYVNVLKSTATRLGISDSLEFCGWLDGSAKHKCMAEAHALLMASAREGWGLVVSEANACGTPAIVYDVPGLRDSVRHESTGLVVQARPANLSEAMIRLISDKVLYARLSAEAQRWSQTLSFDDSVRAILSALQASSPAC